jgi:hypothetical protein
VYCGKEEGSGTCLVNGGVRIIDIVGVDGAGASNEVARSCRPPDPLFTEPGVDGADGMETDNGFDDVGENVEKEREVARVPAGAVDGGIREEEEE